MDSYKNLIRPHTPVMYKPWKPWIPFSMEKYLTPESLKFKVLNSARIRRIVEEMAKGDERKVKQIRAQIYAILMEIGFSRSMPIIKTLGVVTSSIMTRIYDGLLVNEASVQRLKTRVKNTPVLYLPSHRSYADFILMTYVCYSYDIEIPGIAAGMDFFSMKGVGEMLRRTGAFFLRRSFASDKLYWYTFKEYIHALMTVYHSGVEFFLEGTRSRSCKSLPPKIGLLSMALEPLFMGEIPDVTIVPVSIAYERPLEEQLFVYELMGVPKPKESTLHLFKALRKLNDNFGSIYFEFGEPMSVKELLRDGLNQFEHSVEPAQVQELNRGELSTISGLAYDIIGCQQQRSVITTFNLVALAFSYLKFRGQNPSLKDLSGVVATLQRLVKALGAITALKEGEESEIQEALRVHKNLLELDTEVLRMREAVVEYHKINPQRMKGHRLSHQVMADSMPVLTLQLYINPLLCWLAPSALLLLVLRASPRDRVKDAFLKFRASSLRSEFLKLRSIFAQEFVFHPDKVDYEGVWKRLQDLSIIDGEGRVLRQVEADLFVSAIVPFLLCYLCVSGVVRSLETSEFTEKDVWVASQKEVEKLILGRARDVHPYCFSLDSISLAVQSLVANECLEKVRSDTSVKYRRRDAALRELHDCLRDYSVHFQTLDLLYNQRNPKPKL